MKCLGTAGQGTLNKSQLLPSLQGRWSNKASRLTYGVGCLFPPCFSYILAFPKSVLKEQTKHFSGNSCRSPQRNSFLFSSSFWFLILHGGMALGALCMQAVSTPSWDVSGKNNLSFLTIPLHLHIFSDCQLHNFKFLSLCTVFLGASFQIWRLIKL